mmetsp:Transcript_81768/g.264967  ORF Transcript_81768/g.264967 Transcript_81768/m.264967 type:complete len:399 (+) Transcript_81768:611-1807(+)
MRQTRGTGFRGRWRSSRLVSVRTQPSSGKGVRKPREPAAKESTGGMAPWKSETAHVSVPSPPTVITRSMARASWSPFEKVRALLSPPRRSGWSARSWGSNTTTMPCEDSQATMSWTVAVTRRSPGLATTSTARGLPIHCIMRWSALFDSIFSPSLTISGLSPMAEKLDIKAHDLGPRTGEQSEGMQPEDSTFSAGGSNRCASMHAETERRGSCAGSISSSCQATMPCCASSSRCCEDCCERREASSGTSGRASPEAQASRPAPRGHLVPPGPGADASHCTGSLCTRLRTAEPSRHTTQGVASRSWSRGSAGFLAGFAAGVTGRFRDVARLPPASSSTRAETFRTMHSMDCEAPPTSGSTAQRASSRKDSRTACSKSGCNASAAAMSTSPASHLQPRCP